MNSPLLSDAPAVSHFRNSVGMALVNEIGFKAKLDVTPRMDKINKSISVEVLMGLSNFIVSEEEF